MSEDQPIVTESRMTIGKRVIRNDDRRDTATVRSCAFCGKPFSNRVMYLHDMPKDCISFDAAVFYRYKNTRRKYCNRSCQAKAYRKRQDAKIKAKVEEWQRQRALEKEKQCQ